jgi:hypothetical protein
MATSTDSQPSQPSDWQPTDRAIDLLGISRSTIHDLKRRELQPGLHWIYSTGNRSGALLWDVTAIRQWQIERTVAAEAGRRAKQAAQCPELYEGLPELAGVAS